MTLTIAGGVGFGLTIGWLVGARLQTRSGPLSVTVALAGGPLFATVTAWLAGSDPTLGFAVGVLAGVALEHGWMSGLRRRYGSQSSALEGE